MSYRITLSESGEFYRIVALEDVTVELARQWLAEVNDLSREQEVSCFLFDVRNARNISSDLENYYLARRDADRLGLERDARTAILVSEGDTSYDFVETTMQNAGFNVRIFTNEQAAAQWLDEFRGG